jgi:drug/metabolite transporter (DMT)-like permease
MNAFLLAAGVIGATGFWIVNRWAERSGARTEAYRFWLLLFSTLFSGPLAYHFGQSLQGSLLWTCGSIVGLAFSASLALMMFGLKMGPSGPVVASNNMGLLWPVLISVLWLNPGRPTAALITGIVLVCAALLILSFSPVEKDEQQEGSADHARLSAGKWAATLFLLWILAGISMGTQSIAATMAPGLPLAFSFVLNLVALCTVLPFFLLRQPLQIRRCELLPGIVQGVLQVSTMACVFLAIPRIGAEIVFPFVVASPIILMLFVGHFVFHERITRPALAGCVLGTLGLVLLARAG